MHNLGARVLKPILAIAQAPLGLAVTQKTVLLTLWLLTWGVLSHTEYYLSTPGRDLAYPVLSPPAFLAVGVMGELMVAGLFAAMAGLIWHSFGNTDVITVADWFRIYASACVYPAACTAWAVIFLNGGISAIYIAMAVPVLSAGYTFSLLKAPGFSVALAARRSIAAV